MRIILITGISGSGKSVALNALEDAEYYCVDNLPSGFLLELTDFLARAGSSLADSTEIVNVLQGRHVQILYLTRARRLTHVMTSSYDH